LEVSAGVPVAPLVPVRVFQLIIDGAGCQIFSAADDFFLDGKSQGQLELTHRRIYAKRDLCVGILLPVGRSEWNAP
jgi:hypothetical protein